jgi:hypothetical protein
MIFVLDLNQTEALYDVHMASQAREEGVGIPSQDVQRSTAKLGFFIRQIRA